MTRNFTETMLAAGYTLADERSCNMAMIAWNSAVIMLRAAADGAAAGPAPTPATARHGARRPGPNEPCHCGSGRKYKKCCILKATAPAYPPTAGALGPWLRNPGSPPPGAVPLLHDDEAMADDLSRLVEFFEKAPALSEVRFPLFSLDVLIAEVGADGLDDAERFDRAADRIAERTGFRMPDDLQDRLHRAAAGAQSIDAIRTLALASVLSYMHESGPHPLLPVVFRATVNSLLAAEGAVDGVMAKLGSIPGHPAPGAPPECIDEEAFERLKRAAPAEVEALLAEGARRADVINEAIKNGRFPVHTPTVMMLPVHARVTARGPGLIDGNEAGQLLVDAIEDWVPEEDGRLFCVLLERWLETDDGSNPDATAHVRTVRSFAQAGALRPFDWELVRAGLEVSDPCFEEEAPLLEEMRRKEGAVDASILERYGDLLLERGYPALARRTWGLCRHLGPIPEPVAAKISRTPQPPGRPRADV